MIIVRIPGMHRFFDYVADDLMAVITKAVHAGLTQYDPAKGKLDTFIISKAKFGLLESAREHDEVPRALREKIKTIEKIVNGSVTALTMDELSTASGIDTREILRVMTTSNIARRMSYDAMEDFNDEGVTFNEFRSDQSLWTTESDSIVEVHEQELFAKYMQRLETSYPLEHYVISEHLDGSTFVDLSAELERSESRIYQLFKQGSDRMKMWAAADQGREFNKEYSFG